MQRNNMSDVLLLLTLVLLGAGRQLHLQLPAALLRRGGLRAKL